jgi:ubiquinone/menaquinone biosynthesis C-methylase UbiE
MTGYTSAYEPTDSQGRRAFDALAPTYDGLGFLARCGRRLAQRIEIPAGARVLDVATGTGTAAFVAAARVGPTGRVIGVDRSPEMLARARQKLSPAGNPEVEFRQGDATRLDLPDQAFDFVLCASSIFFLPDMVSAVAEWRRVLVPGGWVGVSTFGPELLQPWRARWEECLRRHGLEVASIPTHRLADPDQCREVLTRAGLTDVRVYAEQLGYHLASPEERWSDILSGMEGASLRGLAPDQLAAIRNEHLAELRPLEGDRGLWLDVPALFAFGRRDGDGLPPADGAP